MSLVRSWGRRTGYGADLIASSSMEMPQCTEEGFPRIGKWPATLYNVVADLKSVEAESDEGALQQLPFQMVGDGL